MIARSIGLKTFDAHKPEPDEFNNELPITLPLNGRNSINEITGNRFFRNVLIKIYMIRSNIGLCYYVHERNKFKSVTTTSYALNLSLTYVCICMNECKKFSEEKVSFF